MSPRRQRLDLATLTGVRSGKTSYYRAYVRSDERMQHAVRAMDSISRALVRTVEGPRGLLEEVVRAAAAHLNAEWTVLALADGHLKLPAPFLAADPDARITVDESDLPTAVNASSSPTSGAGTCGVATARDRQRLMIDMRRSGDLGHRHQVGCVRGPRDRRPASIAQRDDIVRHL